MNSKGEVYIANELLRLSSSVRSSMVDGCHSRGNDRRWSVYSYFEYLVGLVTDLMGLVCSETPWRSVKGEFAARLSKHRRRNGE